jgi:hypothetical protein
MLDHGRVAEIAREVAAAKRGAGIVEEVSRKPAFDSDGHETLHVTIVIRQGINGRIGGGAALETLAQLRYRLQEEGDERFPIVEYATREELEDLVIDPDHLLKQAQRLARPPRPGAPRQADLRRAVSSAYYAIFHATPPSRLKTYVRQPQDRPCLRSARFGLIDPFGPDIKGLCSRGR